MERFLFVRIERWMGNPTSEPASQGCCHRDLIFSSNAELSAELIRLMSAAKLRVESGRANIKRAVGGTRRSGRGKTDGTATEGLLLLLLLLPLTLCLSQ